MEGSKNAVAAEDTSSMGGHTLESGEPDLTPIPPPPLWTDKPWPESQYHTHPDSAKPIAYPLIQPDKIPGGWSNDFKIYYQGPGAWNDSYGGMQWDLNERYHIPGRPRLVLFELNRFHEQKAGAKVLIEIGGEFLIMDRMSGALWVLDGDPTLEDVLGHLRGDSNLVCRPWQNDELIQLAHASWHFRSERVEEKKQGKGQDT